LAMEDQRIEAETERVLHTREIAELAERRQVLAEHRTEALAKVEAARAGAVLLREQLSKLEADLRAERVALDGLRENRAGFSNEAAKLRADLEHCESSALTELSVEALLLREDAAVVRVSANELAAAEETCRMLRLRIEQLGPVNMTALDEFRETAVRHEFLEAQRKDLLESIESAQGSIKEIEQVARTKFEEALGRINENFDKVFGWLFYGGHALLRVTDSENQGESGLEIIASPPGKKLQNVLLLSGGEKALTALALLVAVFQYRPSPFCVLDEVDAPLDETNVGRFADLMRSLSRDTQFLVVTHSKRMMQSADLIFGVTMQEPGVSKVFSLLLGTPPTEVRSRGPDLDS
jgi:chromosome segregation protein